MKIISYFFIAVLLVCCGTPKVIYDYDVEKDFSAYTTYNYYPSIESGLNAFENKRIMQITDSILQHKHMIKSDNPQLYINFYSQEYTTHSPNTIGIGVGNTDRNTSVGISGGIPIGGVQVQQLLTIDFIETANDALVWKTEINSSFSERAGVNKLNNHYRKILEKAFQKYPPLTE